MKEIVIRLLSSTLKSVAVALLLAAVAYFTGVNVAMTFTVSFIGQFIFFYLYGSFLEYKIAKTLREQQLKELEILSRITFNIPCAACKQVNEVVINANTDNVFDCAHCNAKNAAYVSAEAALVTTPVNTDL